MITTLQIAAVRQMQKKHERRHCNNNLSNLLQLPESHGQVNVTDPKRAVIKPANHEKETPDLLKD